MTYFTILHWLSLIFFLLLFILLVYLSKKEANKKTFYSMVFASFLVIAMAFVFSIFVLDKYTKKAALYNVSNERLYNSEEMLVKGQVQNIGSFPIGQCSITIRLVNNALGSGGGISGSDVFKPQSWLDFTSKDDKKETSNVLEISKVIATDLHPRQAEQFIIRFRYPPSFNRAMMIDPKLHCR